MHNLKELREDDSKDHHNYMAFYSQLIVVNLIPGLLFSHYMTSYMRDMPFARVENITVRYYLSNAALVLILITLSFTVYNSKDLTNSIPFGGVTAFWTIIMIYCYILWWGAIGVVMLITYIFWGFDQVKKIARSSSSGNRRATGSWLQRLER